MVYSYIFSAQSLIILSFWSILDQGTMVRLCSDFSYCIIMTFNMARVLLYSHIMAMFPARLRAFTILYRILLRANILNFSLQTLPSTRYIYISAQTYIAIFIFTSIRPNLQWHCLGPNWGSFARVLLFRPNVTARLLSHYCLGPR